MPSEEAAPAAAGQPEELPLPRHQRGARPLLAVLAWCLQLQGAVLPFPGAACRTPGSGRPSQGPAPRHKLQTPQSGAHAAAQASMEE